LVALAGLAALVGELVLSVQVISQDLTLRRGGSAFVAVAAVVLGVVGPYSSILAWRSRADATPGLRRVTATALVAFAVGAVAIGWLFLIHILIRPKPYIFVPGIIFGS
jgi:hypothetical protein